MRKVIAAVSLLAVVVGGFQIFSAVGEGADGQNFIRLADESANAELQLKRATECGGYRAVLSEIESRFESRTEQDVFEAEWNYAYAVATDVMSDAVRQGTMHYACFAMVYNSEVSETNTFVLITPDGDFAIGHDAPINHWREGTALTAWSKVDHAGWGFDTFAIADFTDGLSAKVYDEIREVPLVRTTQK